MIKDVILIYQNTDGSIKYPKLKSNGKTIEHQKVLSEYISH